MKPDRFDILARSLAGRVSRRGMLRGTAAGLAATALGASLRPAAARQPGGARYTVIRQYTLSGSADPVIQQLNDGLLPMLSEADGYVSYTVVTSDANTLTTIVTFESQAQYEQASESEADWVQQNLASLLPAPTDTTKGNAIISSVNTDVVCGSAPAPTAVPTTAPTVVPTPCTGIGCPCNGGVQNACDDGLVCCQSQMNGGPMPGGAGMCAAEDACGDGGATPTG